MSDAPTKPYSPDNPAHVKSRKRQAERDSDAVRAAYGWVMSNSQGRLMVRDLINETCLNVNPYGGKDTDFNCGRQDVGQRLVKFVEENFPREYLQLETERLAARVDNQLRDDAARTESAKNLASEDE